MDWEKWFLSGREARIGDLNRLKAEISKEQLADSQHLVKRIEKIEVGLERLEMFVGTLLSHLETKAVVDPEKLLEDLSAQLRHQEEKKQAKSTEISYICASCGGRVPKSKSYHSPEGPLCEACTPEDLLK